VNCIARVHHVRRLAAVSAALGLLSPLTTPGLRAQTATRIPLCAGLTMVGAVSEPAGDYEPILVVERIDDRAVHAKYSNNALVGGIIRHMTVLRTVLKADLISATTLVHWFTPQAPVTMPGTTGFSTSAAVLRALKTKGTAALALVDRGYSALPADRTVRPNLYDHQITYPMQRIGTTPITVPVTVNGTKVDLPAIRVRGEYLGDTAEFHFLDDESNPLALRFQFTPFGSTAPDTVSHTVKISHRCPATAGNPAFASAIEKALAETGRVDVYDIYFDFNSDRIREESAPTLREIGEVLRRHPDWTLAIEGHTDSIGSDADNLQLSRRRASAVKNALVSGHGIGASRLSTNGHGESRPRDRNDTLEGRARNRRVELVRAKR
jgi:outer membrane protein OmpA-like peptidoglycan-associated protein